MNVICPKCQKRVQVADGISEARVICPYCRVTLNITPQNTITMSKIYITSPSGSQLEYDEDQVHSMWEQGLLKPRTQYWKEGMVEWRPLSEYFSPEVSPRAAPTPPRIASGSTFTYTKNPQSLTLFLVIMLWTSLGFQVISILSDFGQMSLLNGRFTEAEAEANDARQALIGFGYLGVFIVTGVAFLKWIYRANLNCRGFGAQDMRFTPGWSVGYYFIPFLNLVRPYQSMKEIWQVSHDPLN